jgi:hypothetical protein
MVLVVADDECNADVTAGNIQQVCAANTASAVSLQRNYSHIGTRQLQPTGIGDRATVQTVEGIGYEVPVSHPDTADISDYHNLPGIYLKLH